MTKLDFIEIGTSNFDTLISKASDKDFGISVEPISYYLNSLPCKTNILKLHAGISNEEGFAEFYYVPEHLIKELKLPAWIKGCNSIHKPHPSVIDVCKKLNIDKDIIHKELVNIVPMSKIINVFNIKIIDFLKIDTEGHDCIILSGILELLSGGELDINKIQFETNSLSSRSDQNLIMNYLKNINYVLTHKGSNCILEKRQI